MIRICFVCLGNICRSPTAEGVMQALVDRDKVGDRITLDSAGTGDWHVGEPPDARASAAAKQHGYRLTGQAQTFTKKHFDKYDYVIAMDQSNRDDLLELAPSSEAKAKVHLLRDFDPLSGKGAEVPDPYFGGEDGFERVLDICTAGCEGLLAHLRESHQL